MAARKIKEEREIKDNIDDPILLYETKELLCRISGKLKKNKARGYVYNKKGTLLYHCHNCGITLSIKKLLENVDYNLYQQYKNR